MFLLTRLNLWSSSTLFGAKKLLVSLFASSRTKCTITNVQQQKAPFPNYHPHSASISTSLPLTHCKSKTKCANGNGYRRWLSAMDVYWFVAFQKWHHQGQLLVNSGWWINKRFSIKVLLSSPFSVFVAWWVEYLLFTITWPNYMQQ